jgi:hypothetical protein
VIASKDLVEARSDIAVLDEQSMCAGHAQELVGATATSDDSLHTVRHPAAVPGRGPGAPRGALPGRLGPKGLDQSRLEDLRLWWTHGMLWWAGLSLSLGSDSDVDLVGVYAAAWHCLENDDPVSWLARDAAAAAPGPAVSYPWTDFICGLLGRLTTRGDVSVHQQHIADIEAHAMISRQRARPAR